MSAPVTVGIPTYNNAATLRRAVESALEQSHPVSLIHISDNCSTDGTADLCRSLAAAHGQILYTRQSENLGPCRNFRFLLAQAQTPYFMWLAGDDYLQPTYVERTVAILEKDPTVVSCGSRVLFVQPDGTKNLSLGTYPLMSDPLKNVAIFLSNPSDCSRFYGVHRTQYLKQALPPTDNPIAFDLAAMAKILMFGKQAEIPEALLIRDETPVYVYMRLARSQRGAFFNKCFPMLRMTRDLVFRQGIPLSLPILKGLVFLNLKSHIEYMRAFHPSYAKIARLLETYIMWRLRTEPEG